MPKNSQGIALFCPSKTAKRDSATSNRKEGKRYYMKILVIVTLAAAAIGLSACSHKEPAPVTTTHSSYSK